MSWTYSYPIPLDSSDSVQDSSDVYSVSLGSNIYIFTDTALEGILANRMDIFVFNTKTTEFRCINYEVPQHFGDALAWIEEDDENIYLWRDCFYCSKNMLYKFDISTESLTHIVSVEDRQHFRNSPIIGDQMYTFAYDDDGTLHLLIIDLSKGELVSKTFLMNTNPEDRNQYMTAKNNQLYILDIISNSARKMYKVVNAELSLISHDNFGDEEDTNPHSCWNGRIDFKKTTENGTVFFTDTFDFEKLTWSREELEEDNLWGPSDDDRIVAEEYVDRVRYVIKDRLGSDRAEYDLQLFEELPKLLTICYLNIVDEVIKNDNHKKFETVKNILHPSMCYELDKLTNWKIREKKILMAEKTLKVAQMKAVTERIIRLENDLIIDSDMSKAFFDVFKPSNIPGIQ